MSEWRMEQGSWKDSDPLGKRAEDFIYDTPNWAIYFRKDPKFVCADHYDQTANSVKLHTEYCEKCLGFGVKTIPIIVPSRLNMYKAKVNLRETDARHEPGYLEYYTAEIDFPRNVYPELEDIVMYCSWNVPFQQVPFNRAARPVAVTGLYQLKSINDHIERELGWYDCGTEAYTFNTGWAEEVLPRLVNLPTLQRENWQKKWW